ncbi:MAG: glycosyltransferase [Deltaproteobacteria bacterium]|nr:MAG: glycosyltransferase [Deltaproteobacteria bacterium]TMQ06379.1 MAG: glycosyltransferase [Deltaproteobacteria bacterium]
MAIRDVTWPFLLVVDVRGRPTGWAALNGPIVTMPQQQQLAELRYAGYRLVGFSSYLTFPVAEPGDPLEYGAICEAWCHCFRTPAQYLPADRPRLLLSVSDFTDPHRLSPARVTRDHEEAFDVIYVGAFETWKREAKNWRLAGRCLPRLCGELGLRALVIGAPDDELSCTPGVRFSPLLPWPELLALLARARLLFVPSVLDASPRLLAEALCLDVPVLVHRDILGGWKYVNRFTGRFFRDETDVVAAAQTCLEAATAPRAWFCANHGPYLAGRRLLGLIRSLDPELSERSHVALAERCEEPLAEP